jgi:hypothetical protein
MREEGPPLPPPSSSMPHNPLPHWIPNPPGCQLVSYPAADPCERCVQYTVQEEAHSCALTAEPPLNPPTPKNFPEIPRSCAQGGMCPAAASNPHPYIQYRPPTWLPVTPLLTHVRDVSSIPCRKKATRPRPGRGMRSIVSTTPSDVVTVCTSRG